jgi:putative DNA primase/helicase
MTSHYRNTDAKQQSIIVSGLSFGAPVGKSFNLCNGRINKKLNVGGVRLTAATPLHEYFNSPAEAFAWRRELGAHTMLFSGNWHASNVDQRISVPKGLKPKDLELWDIIHATKGNLQHQLGGALAIIDVDYKPTADLAAVWPDSGCPLYDTPNAAYAALLAVVPELSEASVLVMDGTSSNIERLNGKDWVQGTGPGSYKIYVAVENGTGVPRLLKVIDDRCWSRGTGCWAFVSSGGQILFRSIADSAMARPTQPDFVAPDLGQGLRDGRRSIEYNLDAPLFDSASIILSGDEKATAEERKKQARKDLLSESQRIIAQRKSAHVKLLVKQGIFTTDAERTADRRYENGVLLGSDLLIMENGRKVAVAQLIEKGVEYDGSKCLDPVEPDYEGGRVVAMFFCNHGKHPGVFSFAHGGRWYRTRHDFASLLIAIESAKGDSNKIAKSIALSDLSLLDETKAYKVAAKAADVPLKHLRLEVQRIREEIRGLPEDASKTESKDLSRPLRPTSFPMCKLAASGGLKPYEHVDNIKHIIDKYGFTYQYDQITKRIVWHHPEIPSGGDHADVQFYSTIQSLCALNGFRPTDLKAHLTAIANQRPRNEVVEYLNSLSWDGVPRFARITEAFGGERRAAEIAFRCFFIGACAAADAAELAKKKDSGRFGAFDQVLTLKGRQGAGKTKFFSRLLPKRLRHLFCESLVLRTDNKDSVKKAISSWIVELGELDATFKKSQIADLKGFLSTTTDELRLPYAPAASRFPRRTLFVATVNEDEFLHDATGNRRFHVVRADNIELTLQDEELDQIWAEAWSRYAAGEQWWPTREEEEWLRSYTENFEEQSDVFLRLQGAYIWSDPPHTFHRKTAPEICDELYSYGLVRRKHTNFEIKQVNQALRKLWSKSPHVTTIKGEIYIPGANGLLVKAYAEGGKNMGWYLPPSTKQALGTALSRGEGEGAVHSKS